MHVGSTAYWQHRVKCMSEPLIKKKMVKSQCDRTEAIRKYYDWVLSCTQIRIHSYETLTASECKSIVAFLHRQSGPFKIRTSMA
jgi:hypothetical protein